MNERRRQSAFLKDLLRGEDSPIGHHLQSQIAKSEQNEKCVRCAFMVVGVMGLLAVSGLCYSAVLLPSFFESSTPFLVKLFTVLALACALCMLVYGGLWLSYRAHTNHLHEEVRRFLLSSAQSKQSGTLTTIVSVHKVDTQVIRLETNESPQEQQLPISKAS